MAGERFQSFGRATPAAKRTIAADTAVELMKSGKAKANGLLAYGNGRSYGDSCQNEAGAVVDMRPLNRIGAFNAETGLLEAEAGVLLSDIIAHVDRFVDAFDSLLSRGIVSIVKDFVKSQVR